MQNINDIALEIGAPDVDIEAKIAELQARQEEQRSGYAEKLQEAVDQGLITSEAAESLGKNPSATALAGMNPAQLALMRAHVRLPHGTRRYEFGGLHCNNSLMSNDQVGALVAMAESMKLSQESMAEIVARARKILGNGTEPDYSLLSAMLHVLKDTEDRFLGDPEPLPGGVLLKPFQNRPAKAPVQSRPKRRPKSKKPKNKTVYR